jgi:hypothetical protein
MSRKYRSGGKGSTLRGEGLRRALRQVQRWVASLPDNEARRPLAWAGGKKITPARLLEELKSNSRLGRMLLVSIAKFHRIR